MCDKRLIWMGPRQSDISECEPGLFDGSITIFGSGYRRSTDYERMNPDSSFHPFNVSACSSDLYCNHMCPQSAEQTDESVVGLHRFDHNKYSWQIDLFMLYYPLYLLSTENKYCDPAEAAKKNDPGSEYYFLSYNQNAVSRDATELQFLLLADILGYTGEPCLSGASGAETISDSECIKLLREHYNDRNLKEAEASFLLKFHKRFMSRGDLLYDKIISESDLNPYVPQENTEAEKADQSGSGSDEAGRSDVKALVESRSNRTIDDELKRKMAGMFRDVVGRIIDLGDKITAMQVLDIQKLLYERSLCVNMNTNLLDLLENKQRFRGELCRYLDIPAVDDVIISRRDNSNCTVGYLRKKVGGNAFVLQKPVSSGGHKTYFLRCPEPGDNDNRNEIKSINIKISEWVNSVDEMVVSQYREHNVPFNVHAMIGSDQILMAPTSMQLIRNVNEKLIYCGADYPAYRQFVKDNPTVADEVSNYVIWLCKALQSRGYRGIVGFDYIVSDRVEFVESNNRFQASTPLINKALREMRYRHDPEGNILDRFDGKRIVSGCSSPSMQMLNLFAFSNDKDPLMDDLSDEERDLYKEKCEICHHFIKRVYGDIDPSYLAFPIDRNDLLELTVPESMVIYYADRRNDSEYRRNGMLTHPELIWSRLRLFYEKYKEKMANAGYAEQSDIGEAENGAETAAAGQDACRNHLTPELKDVLMRIADNLCTFFEYDCNTKGFSENIHTELKRIVDSIRQLYDFREAENLNECDYRSLFRIISSITSNCEKFDEYMGEYGSSRPESRDVGASRFVRSVYMKIIDESLSEHGQKYSLGAKDRFERSNVHRFLHDDNIDQYIVPRTIGGVGYWGFDDPEFVDPDNWCNKTEITSDGWGDDADPSSGTKKDEVCPIDDGAYLFKMYVRGNVCSSHLGEPHPNPNLFAPSRRWNGLIADRTRDNMLALKIGLINSGAFIRDAETGPDDSIVLHMGNGKDCTIRRGVNHSVDIVVSCSRFTYQMAGYTSLPVNVPCFTDISDLSPFELVFSDAGNMSGDGPDTKDPAYEQDAGKTGAGAEASASEGTVRELCIRYYGKNLRYHPCGAKNNTVTALRTAELYLDVSNQPGTDKPNLTEYTMVPYSSICLLATDRLRYQHCDHCKFAMNKVGCQFCEKTVYPPAEEYEFNEDEIVEVIENTVNEEFNQTIGGESKPARHVLIGGGSMAGPEFLVKARIIRMCEAVRKKRRDVPIYLMCLPPSRLKDMDEYKLNGVTEVSFNIEIFDQRLAHRFMPGKSTITLSSYISALRYATRVWPGPGQVRSSLIIGLEQPESSLECVKLLASLGVAPILSIFRPVPGTKLGCIMPMDSESLYDFFIRSNTICRKFGVDPGPSCIYCQNNTVAIPGELYDREVPGARPSSGGGRP